MARDIAAPTVPTTHQGLISWVNEIAELTQPDNVVWCDGHVSSEEWGWNHGPTNYYGGNNNQGFGWFGPKDNSLFYSPKKYDLTQKR